jgi:hypothetical protein
LIKELSLYFKKPPFIFFEIKFKVDVAIINPIVRKLKKIGNNKKYLKIDKILPLLKAKLYVKILL